VKKRGIGGKKNIKETKRKKGKERAHSAQMNPFVTVLPVPFKTLRSQKLRMLLTREKEREGEERKEKVTGKRGGGSSRHASRAVENIPDCFTC